MILLKGYLTWCHHIGLVREITLTGELKGKVTFTFDYTQFYHYVKEKGILKAAGRSEFYWKGNTQSKNILWDHGIKREVIVNFLLNIDICLISPIICIISF